MGCQQQQHILLNDEDGVSRIVRMVVQKRKLNSRHHHPVEMTEERIIAVQFRSEGKRKSAGLGTTFVLPFH